MSEYLYTAPDGSRFRVERAGAHSWSVFVLAADDGGPYETPSDVDDCDTEQEAVAAFCARVSHNMSC